MKIKNKAKYILIALIVTSIFFFTCTLNMADSESFNITVGSSAIKTGEKFAIIVTGMNITNLYAYEINLTFDEGLLSLVDVVSNIEGYSIPTQVKGNRIKFAMTKVGDKPPESGNLTLCTLTFEAKATGTSAVTLNTVKILDEILKESNYFVNKSVAINISKDETIPIPPPPPPTNDPIPPPPPTNDPIPSPPPSEYPMPPTQTTTESDPTLPSVIEAVLDDNGIAVAGITANDIKVAADNEEDGVIYLKVNTDENVNFIKINMPAQEVGKIGDGKTLKVDTGIGTVTFSSDFIKEIISSGSENIEFLISRSYTEDLPQNVSDTIGNITVYSFSLNVDETPVSCSKLGEKFVIFEVDYTLKPGESPHKVIVYNIDDSGKFTIQKSNIYNASTGKIKFRLQCFNSQYVVAHAEVSFDDIGNVLWAKESIEALAARSIVRGIGGGNFNPNGYVTRAEFIKMLMEAFDLIDENARCEFIDVKEGAWYYSAIASAWKLGIVKGKDDFSFGVNDRISREDMAVMVYRTAMLVKIRFEGKGKAEFADKAQIAPYAVDAIETMYRAGIISGIGEGLFAPKDGATRAQAAVIIYKLLNLYHLNLYYSNIISF